MPLSMCPSGVYVFLKKNPELKNVIIDFFISDFIHQIGKVPVPLKLGRLLMPKA